MALCARPFFLRRKGLICTVVDSYFHCKKGFLLFFKFFHRARSKRVRPSFYSVTVSLGTKKMLRISQKFLPPFPSFLIYVLFLENGKYITSDLSVLILWSV